MAQPDADNLLHRQFEKQARKSPDAVALYEGTRSINFADLDARADRVARALRTHGIGAGSAVGLHLERSVSWVIAVLGILKANAAVMPLPPSYPPGRLRGILTHAALDGLIDDAATPFDRSTTTRVLSLDNLLDGPDTPGEIAPGQSDQAAFILCSSGSTDAPKMIERSHASFQHRLRWTWGQHPYSAGEICLQKAHATTTHGIYELFEPLLRGIPVVILPDEEARDLEGFWDTIRNRRISRLLIVPSALQSSLDMPGFTPPALNVVVLMGEYVNPRLAERAVTAFPARTHVYSIYGSTEASSTLVCDLRESFRPGQELPLGKPISNDVRVLIMGPNGEPVKPGEAGGLYVAGSALFTGYFRNPDLTATVLIHGSSQGDPLYDTHDRVRSMPDGSLQFIGRIDDTVKIRGFRADLQEVERALLGHPGVHQAAAIVGSAASGGATLHAFVSPASLDRDAIYRSLRDRLPAYMLPSTVVGLDEFPLTDRGKLDRARLLQHHAARGATSGSGRTPPETERRVSDVWARTLGHNDFSFGSNFFEVGGTSLTVFSLVHRLRTAFALDRVRLPEQSVYRYPTVETLATCIDRMQNGRPATDEQGTPILVTMRQGTAPDQAPLFVIASAGGTLGAYEKLARELHTPREIIGVRDPFIWGEREMSEGYQRWAGRYVAAIRERQPQGPYYVAAYSSAGSFGYEIARQLRGGGQEVAVLVLIDPLALDRRDRRSYGWWALRATYERPPVRALIRLAGWLRVPMHKALGTRRRPAPANDFTPSAEEARRLTGAAVRDAGHLLSFAALLELNTGLPFALTEADFAGVPPDGYLGVLQARIATLMPDVDPTSIERTVVQYTFQVRAQHAYELQAYDGCVLLVEPATRYRGVTTAHLRPYVRKLQVRAIKLSEPPSRIQTITDQFGAIAAHYRSMRDDQFVNGLAREIERVLDGIVRPAQTRR
ncbi:MAG: AMP-binding protein [Gemmatimonadaceae bacterium]